MLQDVNVEDSLALSLYGTFDRQLSVDRELEPFLKALETYADECMPSLVMGRRRRKYSRAAIWKALEEERTDNSASVALHRPASPAVELALRLWFPPLPPRLYISLDAQPLAFFAEAERCARLVDMVRTWAMHYPISYAMAHGNADNQLSDFPTFGRDSETWQRDGFDKIYEVYWLNIFGPRLVQSVGRERMLSTPAWRVEELPHGAVLVVTGPTAADFASEEARQAQARALVHLRPELNYDTVLSTLRQRSATLAPVEPRFHPDVAPLLCRTLDDFALSERQRKVAEYNAWQPPEPEEWAPVASALPPDVEDLQGTLAQYGTLSERLVALLHTQVPSVLRHTPESLTDADYHFWHQHFPESFARRKIDELAVPAVGGYLGEVLVRHLGGQWIPRRNLMEAQVRVGSRIWYPFLRAHRYMRSRQSLLDCSLTQLFRVAERHRR